MSTRSVDSSFFTVFRFTIERRSLMYAVAFTFVTSPTVPKNGVRCVRTWSSYIFPVFL
ncbi:MAG TPA: hypothetical protein VER33_25965 [Polyangiaceae bacterium]|nr:hypothetical protein [Polyangiaceae bacterium]